MHPRTSSESFMPSPSESKRQESSFCVASELKLTAEVSVQPSISFSQEEINKKKGK